MSSNAKHNLRIRGARANNLRGVDLDLPLGQWVSVCGPSGSGKTSLVFDTLVREGERRFLGSLSVRARHFFGKLGRPDVDSIENLPPTIAIGERATTPHARSTVGTLTGCLDLLRLVFARCAVHESGTPLTRSHFSFNHEVGQCDACKGLGVEDQVDPAKIIADSHKSIRDGALVPTLKNGYTVYSQVTLEVMNDIAAAHGFDVDTPWIRLSAEQQGVIMHGTRALKVPFGKHSIESRMKWEGITARPREEGFYRGLIPVIEETLKRNRNANILRFVTSVPCSTCAGSRLGPLGREARFGDFTLPGLLALPADGLLESMANLPNYAVWLAASPPITKRIERLVRLGLGHLALDRASPSLSGGEAQRVRLAAQLGAELSGVLFALDEPTLGLHPESQTGMAAVLDELVDTGNHLVVVEHDPDMVRHADRVIALGPGAGREGGELVDADVSAENPIPTAPELKAERREGMGSLTLMGATLHNLQSARLTLLLGALNVIIGPSGAGKSSLVFGTLLPALLNKPGGAFELLEFEERLEEGQLPRNHAAIQAVDARPIGKTSRSTPATWCGLFDLVRKRFAATEDALQAGFTSSHFSFNSKSGRCPACEGLGVIRIGLHLFEDVELLCDACQGARFRPEVLVIRLNGKSIGDVLKLSFHEAAEFFEGDPDPARICAAMLKLGLGYLSLGQPSGSLSRGESQRIKLGTLLGSKQSQSTERTVILLDEPDRGLAPSDAAALIEALDALVEIGHTVIAISHHRHMWAAADRLIEVRGGQTNHEPEVDMAALSTRKNPRTSKAHATPIQLRGAKTHNLAGIDVDFPRGKLTAVCGVSGSGKSSLVFDTLAAAASARFAESLPFQVRRFMRLLPAPDLESASGLTPTLNLRQTQAFERTSSRSTLATLSEIGPLLRLAFSRAGLRDGKPCELTASHFSRERVLGACPDCTGRGTLKRCDPTKLVAHPGLPLVPNSPKADGAISATRPGRYFGEPAGQYMATLAAALPQEFTLKVLAQTPWSALPSEVQNIALSGTGEVEYEVDWQLASKVEGTGTHKFQAKWAGLAALVEAEAKNRARSKKATEWAEPLGDIPCPTCSASGLAEPARETKLAQKSLPEIEALALVELEEALTRNRADDPSAAALAKLLPEITERTDELIALGLGHLNLGRKSASLSQGELQRARLASVLRTGLCGVTLVLDEPAAGLHERDVASLLVRLRRFQAAGNTVVIVSHRTSILSAADHVIEMGPGAGPEGGQVMPGPWQPKAQQLAPPKAESTGANEPPQIHVQGANARNLKAIDIAFPAQGFIAVTGVSGSGKTSLVFEVLKPSLQNNEPKNCAAITIPAAFETVLDTRQTPNPRQTALAALGLENEIAALFDEAPLPKRAFKLGDPKGRCPACKGSGIEHVPMDFLADLDLACQACAGQRFNSEVLGHKWNGQTIAEVLAAPASQLLAQLKSGRHKKLFRALEALAEVAAAHIPLGRPRKQLSGGESNRLTLAVALLAKSKNTAFLFDEPARGLAETDLAKLHAAFRKLTTQGNLVIATEHRLSTIAAADFVIDLGPEGGANGGQLIESGPPSELRRGHTAAALNPS